MKKQEPKHPLKEIRGIQVFVTDSGRFVAEIGGREVKKATLRDLEKAIEHHFGAVKVFHVEGFVFYERDFVGINSGGDYRDKESGVHRSWKTFYFWDEKIAAALRDVEARYKKAVDALEKERDALLRGTDRVHANSLRAHLNRKQSEPDHGEEDAEAVDLDITLLEEKES